MTSNLILSSALNVLSSKAEGASDWTSVAALPDGGYIVVWHDGGNKDGDRSGVYARRYDTSGTQIGDEIQVNTLTSGFQSKARVAATSDGHFMVVWTDDNGSLQGQIFNPDSTPSGEQFTVGPWYNAQADIIGTSDNQFAVVRMQTNQHTAMLSIFDTDGTQVVDDTFLSEVRAGEPRVVELEPGRFLSVWYDMSNNSGFEIWGQAFDASGTLVGDAFVLNSTLANNQQAPEIVATGDGGFAAVWQSFDQDGDLFDIYFRLFDNSGVASSDEILINQSLTAQQIKPSIERSPDGTLIVAWESYHLGAAQIFVQRLSSTGVLLGDNKLVSVDDSGLRVNGTEVDLATLTNGSVLATWDVGGTVYSRIVHEFQVESGSSNAAPVLTVGTNVETLVDTSATAVAYSATDSDADDLSFSFSDPKYGAVTINDDGTFTYTPDAGYVGSDQFVISVSDGAAQAREVVRIDVRPPSTPADFSELQIISPKSDGGSDWTSVASMPGGGFVVVWHDGGGKDGDRSGVYARLYDANYQRLVDEFQVNSKTTDFQTKARVASTPDGHFMVVWAGGDGSLQAQVFDSAGAKQGAQFTVGPWFVAEADIQGTSDNKFVVVRTQNNENAGILAMYNSDGTELVNNVALSDVLASEARVIELIDGRLLASWWDARNAEGTEIYGRYFDATGTLLGDAFKLNQTLANNQQAPEIVALESGGFAVVWQSEESSGGTFDIYARLFDADGNAYSDDILVSDDSTGQQVKPAIESASDDTLVIAWESNHLGRNQIVYQTLSSDGEKKGTNQVASQTSQSTNVGGTEVALATLEDGSVLATWDIGGDVYGRILHKPELPVEPVLEVDLSAIRLVSGMGNLEDIDVFSNGKYFITRWASDGSGNAQGFQIADPNFQNITPNEVLNNYTDLWQQFGTSVLVAQDQMLSTWDGSKDSENQPITPAQITDSAGNIIRDDFAMSESLGGNKQMVFKDGLLYLASSTGGDVLLSTYDGTQDFSLIRSQVVNSPSDYRQIEPDIALIDDSHLVIAYQSNTDPDFATVNGAFSVKGDSDIRFTIYDLISGEQSTDFVIAQSGAIGLKEPQVAAIGEGRFLITWTETTYDNGAIATHFAQAYSADGSAISDTIEVASYTLGSISSNYPGGVTDIRYAVDTALTAGPSGTAIFAWNQHDLSHPVFDGGVATLELNDSALNLTDKQLVSAIDVDSSAGIREPVIYTHPTDGYGVIFNSTPDTALIVPVLSKVDQIAPSIPEIYVVAGDDEVTADELAGVTIGGTAEPGSILQLTSNYPDSTVFETITDLNGKWLFEYDDFSIEGTLVDGAYELYATATDAAGNTSDVTTRLVEVDLVDETPEPTGDLLDLQFSITETPDDKLILHSVVELSDNFSQANSVSLLFWKIGEDQTWLTLNRNETGAFEVARELNRFTPSGSYAVRSIRATDDFGAAISFTEDTIKIAGFESVYDVFNSKSDIQKPVVDAFTISDFYFEEETEQWAFDYSLAISDVGSGINPSHIVELTSPSGKSLQAWRTADADGTLSTTRYFPKYIASGDYSINSIRISDLAGNEGDYYSAEAIQALLGRDSNTLTLENPYADNLAPTLTAFELGATFNETTLRPSITLDFEFEELGGSGYNSAYVRMVGDGHFDDRWISDLDTEKPGIQFQLDLVSEYTPGEFTAGWFILNDNAANSQDLGASDIEALGFNPRINVFYKPDQADGSFIVRGADTDDWVIGSLATDTLDGGDGADVLYSAGGDDSVDAGSGDDLIIGGNGAGDDHYDGNTGIDTVKYSSATAGIYVDLVEGVAYSIESEDSAGIGYDTLTRIENVIAAGYSDILIGSALANVVYADGGNDRVDGGDGDDTLYGGDGDDKIYAGEGNDAVYGGAGNDVIFASGGADFEDGGDGIDTLAVNGYSTTITDVTYNLLEGSQGITGGQMTENAFANFENFTIGETFNGETIVSNWNLTIVGTDGSNLIKTSAGDDVVTSLGGDDTVLTGDGDDQIHLAGGENTVDAGSGQDTVIFSLASADFSVRLLDVATVEVSNPDHTSVLRNVEQIRFSDKTLELVAGELIGVVGGSGTEDVIAPDAPFIAAVAGDDVVQSHELEGVAVGGTAEPGATISLSSNYPESPTFTTEVDAQGNWSFSYADFGFVGTPENGVYTIIVTVTDVAGNTSEATTKSVTVDIQPTNQSPATGAGLSGKVYHWSSHQLLDEVNVQLNSDPYTTSISDFSLLNMRDTVDGSLLIDLYFDAGEAFIDSVDLDIHYGDLAFNSFQWGDAIKDQSWSTSENTSIDGVVKVSGFGLNGELSGNIYLGTLEVTTSGPEFDLSLVSGLTSLGLDSTHHSDVSFSTVSETFISDAMGGFAGSLNAELAYSFEASRDISDAETGRVISAADALAALKIAVGINPNGTDLALSPYQLLSADVNEDGRVSAADALSILKMAVGLEGAPTREWGFVRESEDFINADGSAFSRSKIDWDQLEVSQVSDEVNLIAFLKGDVNGSWPAPAGTGLSELPESYFTDIETAGIAPAEQWWVV